jgi:PAS domain S-box-containing protein
MLWDRVSRSALLPYLAAILLVLAAAAVRMVFWGAFGTRAPFVTFYPAMMTAALLGGFSAGMLATALSAIWAWLFLLEPVGSLSISEPADLLALVVFCTSCTIVSYLSAVIHRSRARAREAEALHKYELLAAYSRDIILFMRHNDGRILEANAAACTAYGYEREELLKLTIYDLCAPGATELTANDIAEAYSHGVLFESLHRRRDGCVFPVEIGSRGATIEGVDVLISEVRDVTERKRAEEALRAALDRAEWLGRFPEENPSPVVRVSGDGSVLYRNPAAAKLPGWACEVGRPAPDALLPLIGQTMAEKRTTQHEADLDRRLFSVVLTPSDAEGYTNIYGLDITERKLAEDALRAKDEELRTMSRQLWQSAKLATMGELAASIAHELNNPLATVGLHVESMLGQTGPDEPRHRVIEVVEEEVDRMANLVANLLQFSRRSQPQISTVDVREEIDKTLELIHYHLRKQRITVVREFADEPPIIQADRQHLRQLFLNLITNAGDAMPQGGTLTIRVSATDHVTVEIIDTGVGIAPEDLPRVIEPFFTTKPEGKGTGLGLPMCLRIAKEHGGKLKIASEPGKGTTVRVVLSSQSKVNGTILTGDD